MMDRMFQTVLGAIKKVGEGEGIESSCQVVGVRSACIRCSEETLEEKTHQLRLE